MARIVRETCRCLAVGLLLGGIGGTISPKPRTHILKRCLEDEMWRRKRDLTYSVICDICTLIRTPDGRRKLGLSPSFFSHVLAGDKICIRPNSSWLRSWDAWGRFLLIKARRPVTRANDGPLDVIVWSVGPNGVDENGHGDDICLLDYSFFLE